MKLPAEPGQRWLKRFQAKWMPVRVKKTRQNKQIEPPFRFNRNGKGSGSDHVAAGFFLVFGFAMFGCATGSGPRSIDERRPAVNV
jgi:hypothetical protein